MATAPSIQRTLIVGRGEAGAKTADRLLGELAQQVGRLEVVAGLAVLTAEVALDRLEPPLLIPPDVGFEAWLAEFEARVRLALQQISRLDNLAGLARQGLTLDYPDEVQLWLIADLAEPQFMTALPAMAESLRLAVYRTLTCQAGLSGLVLSLPQGDETEPLVADQFDRGCFVAGLTNEAGLIIGGGETLIRFSAYFLSLLIRDVPVTGSAWPGGWDRTLTHFGLAHVRWPGEELLPILSLRWADTLLAELIAATPPDADPARQAREAAQQWLTAARLAPLLLIERLAADRPPPPQHLADLVPDPPWPWQLVEIEADLEARAEQWQADWSADRARFETTLTDLESNWPAEADTWLRRQAATPAGAVVRVQALLAAVSELLRAFVEGIEQKLEEAETEQAELDRRYSRAAQELAETLAGFPASPMSALFAWGWRPFRWLEYGAMCRQAQSEARHLAHLLRARLLAWQAVWYFEELLPFYRRLLAAWREIVESWTGACRQVSQARQRVEQADWAGQLDRLLADDSGPWTASLVAALYHQTVGEQVEPVWRESGSLSEWQAAALETDGIVTQLQEVTTRLLQPALTISVDRALRKQFPEEETLNEWLAGLAEQARPFWPYDETALTESSRGQTRLERWLLLAEGEESPLAAAVQSWGRPPVILTSPDPAELAVVTVRQVQYLSDVDENTDPKGLY